MKTTKRLLAGLLAVLVVLVTNIGIIPAVATEAAGPKTEVMHATKWQRSSEESVKTVQGIGNWNYADMKDAMQLQDDSAQTPVWDGGKKGSAYVPGKPAVAFQPEIKAEPEVKQQLAVWNRTVVVDGIVKDASFVPNNTTTVTWEKGVPSEIKYYYEWKETKTEVEYAFHSPGEGWVRIENNLIFKDKWQRVSYRTKQFEESITPSNEWHGNNGIGSGNYWSTVWEKVSTDKIEKIVSYVWKTTTIETYNSKSENDNPPVADGWKLANTGFIAYKPAVIGRPEIPAQPEVAPIPAVQGQYFTEYSTRNDITWASWKQIGPGVNLRLFRGNFEIPADVNIISAKLGTIGADGNFSTVVPINDSIYVYINGVDERRMTWSTQGHTQPAANEYAQSNYWFANTDGTELKDYLRNGQNVLDVFTEENAAGGGMNELVMQITTAPKDLIAPVIIPDSKTDVAKTSAATWVPKPTATDNVDGDITKNIKMTYSSEDSGSTVTDLSSAQQHLGTVGHKVTVKYDVDDAANNHATQVTQTFTAVADPDTTKPVITPDSKSSITISEAATWSPAPTATDDVDGDITKNIKMTYSSEDNGNNVTDLLSAQQHLGTVGHRITVKYDVDDAAKNHADQVTQIFTAIANPDTAKPVITPDSKTSVTKSEAATWSPAPTATDDVDGNITQNIKKTYSSEDSGSNVTDLLSAQKHLETVGHKVIVKYDVDDAAKNHADQVTQIFTAVSDLDKTPPVIAPVANANVRKSMAGTWNAPTTTAKDDVDGDITSRIEVSYTSDDSEAKVSDLESARTHLKIVGNTVKVTYTVYDSMENRAIVSAIFTSVADPVSPTPIVTPIPEKPVVVVPTATPTEIPVATVTPVPTLAPVATPVPVVAVAPAPTTVPVPTVIPTETIPAGAPTVAPTPEATPAPEETPVSEATPTPEPIVVVAPEKTAGAPVAIPKDTTPGAAAKLPKTGGVPETVFYGFGAGLIALGVVIRKISK